MQKRSKIFYILLTLLFSACGDNKKQDSIAEITTTQKQELHALSNSNLKELKSEDQAKVVEILWQQLLNDKWLIKLKQLCHIAGLRSINTCEEVRDQCLKGLSKISEDEFKGKLKQKEAQIKNKLSNYIKDSELKAEELELVLGFLNKVLKSFPDLDCGTTLEEIENFGKKLEADLHTKYGREKLEQITKLANKLQVVNQEE